MLLLLDVEGGGEPASTDVEEVNAVELCEGRFFMKTVLTDRISN